MCGSVEVVHTYHRVATCERCRRNRRHNGFAAGIRNKVVIPSCTVEQRETNRCLVKMVLKQALMATGFHVRKDRYDFLPIIWQLRKRDFSLRSKPRSERHAERLPERIENRQRRLINNQCIAHAARMFDALLADLSQNRWHGSEHLWVEGLLLMHRWKRMRRGFQSPRRYPPPRRDPAHR